MDSVLIKLKKDIILKCDEILKNQKEEYNDLEKISVKLLGKGYKELFRFNDLNHIELLSTNEQVIENYGNFIREKWLERVFYHTYKVYKSPRYGQLKKTISGRKIDFEYERTLKPLEVEQHLYKQYEGYTGFSMLFSNAMSSLTAVYSLVNKLYRNKNENIKGLAMIGYFESLSLSMEYNKNINIDYVINQNDRPRLDLSEYNFFILEPVRPTFNLDITNVEKLLYDLSNLKNDSLKVLVIDSSLLGPYFDISGILNFLNEKSNFIIIDIRSGVKMDQQGMELSNCGVINIYVKGEFLKFKNYIQKHLTNYRSITGTGLSFYEICLLDNDVFFSDKAYAKKILNNNKDFFYSLSNGQGKAISEVIYPYYRNPSHYYESPFLYLKLKKDNRSEYEKLFELMQHYFKTFELDLISRNSFGFRNLTVEYFMNLNDESLVFKIACGKLKGLKYYVTLSLINILLNIDLENFDKLHAELSNSEEKNGVEK